MNRLLPMLAGFFLFFTYSALARPAKSFSVSLQEEIAPMETIFNASQLHLDKQAEVFIWDFGNGEKLITINPVISYTYKTAGTFSASLRYLKNKQDKVDKAKDGGSATIVVRPNQLPQLQLSCSSDEVNTIECNAEGSNDVDGLIKNFRYEWGDQTFMESSSTATVKHVYIVAGSKNIRLVATDNKGGVAILDKNFTVKANTPPVAGFTCNKVGIQRVHCESTSTDLESEITNFKWTLDDGTVYTTSTFDHTFNKRPQDVALSSHAIELQVTDGHGLPDSISKDVEVDLEPIREAPRAYFKVFMEGTSVKLHSFIVPTQFAIKRAYYKIFGEDSALLKTIELEEFYANTVSRADLEKLGNYRVVLYVQDWRDQQTHVARSFQLVEDTSKLAPYVDFRAVQSAANRIYINLNYSFDFDEYQMIKSFTVNFGDGQEIELGQETFTSHQYAEAGSYTITVTAKTDHGTQKSVPRQISVTSTDLPILKPDPTFNYLIYDFAQNVTFYNEKSGTPNGEIISYVWDFGDGDIGHGETQAHFYAPGTYLVSLTVTDTAGLKSTQTQKITVMASGPDIVANIDCSLNLPYVDITQKCKVSALDRLNELSRVRVIWGDGTAANLTNPADAVQGLYYPSKNYANEGNYPVRLIVNTQRGDTKTHETSLNLSLRKPVASIQCQTNYMLVFCDAFGSYDPKGLALTYEFDFGNGQVITSTTGAISYSYPAAGLYDVIVKVTDASGLSGSALTKVMPVEPPNELPIAGFNCNSPGPLTLHCWDEGTYDPDGTVAISKLSFDDGTMDFLNPQESTRHQFSVAGVHAITLTVIDEDGGETTLIKNFAVSVNNPPIASFECNRPGPQRLSCYSTSEDLDAGDFPIKFEWSYGDGNLQSGLAGWFDHVYAQSSEYTVGLTITDKYGAQVTIEKKFVTLENEAPVANAYCEQNNNTISCNGASSYDPDGQIVSFKWLVDQQQISGANILYSFTNGGTKKVIFEATDNLGKTSTKEITLEMTNMLAAQMACVKINNYRVSCDASQSLPSGGAIILNYKIEFSDEAFFKTSVAEYEFQSSGNKKIILSLKDELGAQTQVEQIIKIEPIYLLPSPHFEDLVETFREVIFDASFSRRQDREVQQYKWDFGDGTTATTATEIVNHTYQSNSNFTVSLTVVDKQGAQSTFTKGIYIYDPQVEDPGESGKQNVLGIDSDNDQVRDDIQRWIQYESAENLDRAKYLKAIAKIYEDNFTNVNNLALVKGNFLKLYKAEQCLSLAFDEDEKVESLKSLFRVGYGNTDERFNWLLKIDQSFAGESMPEQMGAEELATYCQGVF